MPTPQPPSQQQAEEAHSARWDAEAAILALFTSVESGGGEGDGEDDLSALHAVAIASILVALSAAIVLASFRSPRGRTRSLLSETLDHERVSETVLPAARSAFKELSHSELTDEQKAVLWATEMYSRTADELARTINSGEIPHKFTEQGLQLRKIWISRTDGRVRPLHAKLHGKTVPISDDFWRWPHSGERLRWPGDREAPADATIGCRCVSLLTWATQQGVSSTIKKIAERTRPN